MSAGVPRRRGVKAVRRELQKDDLDVPSLLTPRQSLQGGFPVRHWLRNALAPLWEEDGLPH